MNIYVFSVSPIQCIWLEAVFKSAAHEYEIIQHYPEESDWWTSVKLLCVDEALPLQPAG